MPRVKGEGAAAFPTARGVPGGRALRTGPWNRGGGDGGGQALRGQPGSSRCRIVPPGRDSDLEASVIIPQLVAWPHWLLSLAYFIFYKDFFFIFKVFIEFVITLLLFYVLVYWPQGHVGSQVPNRGLNLHPLHWKVKS